MSLRPLPSFDVLAFARPEGLRPDLPDPVLETWVARSVRAEEGEDTITMFDVIGEDWWSGEGVTSKRIEAALRKIGAGKPVTVLLNSPGGDYFEGVAIFNLLARHSGRVTIKVLGLAASAASVIAMAGDDIEMGVSSNLMIHNAWGVCVGDRHDQRKTAETLEKFDVAMAKLYAARAGGDVAEFSAMMDAETWLSADDAIARGLADALSPLPEAFNPAPEPAARRALASRRRGDLALARAGLSRSERINFNRAYPGDTPRAVPGAMLSAGDIAQITAALRGVSETLLKDH